MPRVYGDSTPFPHDLDYIYMLRDGVDCAVRLLSAQHSIRVAEERGESAERTMRTEVTELNALLDRVQGAAARPIPEGMQTAVRAATQIAGGARTVIDAAVRELEAMVQGEMGQARHIMDKARETSASALDQFLERHTPPDSRLCLQLTANPEVNVGHVTLVTPFGVSAVFGLAIPSSHAWARPRRVADLVPHLEVQMPKEAGWISKRVEMAPLRLERSFISDVTVAERSGVLRLRRGACTGPGHELRVDLETGVRLSICPVREDGSVDDQQPLVLEGEDQRAVLSLWQAVVESAVDLMHMRQRMVSASFEGRPLLELEGPRVVAEALINHMAPVVAEISRRSGAPGELVLRRNLGEGRREETYCTHAELLEKIMMLPPDLRVLFSPLQLSGSLVSAAPPGAPALPAPQPSAAPLALPAGARESRRPSLNAQLAAEELVVPAALSPATGRPPSVPPPESSPPPAG